MRLRVHVAIVGSLIVLSCTSRPALSQEQPSEAEWAEHCPNGCVHVSVDFETEPIFVREGGQGTGGASGHGGGSTSSGGGPASPGGGSPGVEPATPMPLAPVLVAPIFSGIGTALGGNRGGSRGNVDYYSSGFAGPPVGVSAVTLTQVSSAPSSAPSVPSFVLNSGSYFGWDRSFLGQYVETAASAEYKVAVWDSHNGNFDKANATASTAIGTSASGLAARSQIPQRIAASQQNLALQTSLIANLTTPRSGVGGIAADNNGTLLGSNEISENTYEWTKKAIDIGTERALWILDKDMDRAKGVMAPAEYAKYLEGAKDTRSVVSGLGKLLTDADYAISVKKILQADPGNNKTFQEAQLAYKFGSDLAAKASQKGITAVVKIVLPSVEPYLTGIFSGVGIVFDSEKISPDPAEIVRDNTGHSLTERTEALAQELHWYEQQNRPDDAKIQDLLEQVAIIYGEQQKLTKPPQKP
jgi:hypothetical protein